MVMMTLITLIKMMFNQMMTVYDMLVIDNS